MMILGPSYMGFTSYVPGPGVFSLSLRFFLKEVPILMFGMARIYEVLLIPLASYAPGPGKLLFNLSTEAEPARGPVPNL